MAASFLSRIIPMLNSGEMSKGGEKKRRRRIILIGAAIAIAILVMMSPLFFLLYMSYKERKAEPQAAQTQRELESEYKKISPLPRSVQVQYGSTYKPFSGLIHTASKTELSYSEIRAYYDSEFSKNNWKLARESRIKYDGQDYGGVELFYCKGRYTAELQYAGRQEGEFGWTYSIDFTWPLSDECR